MGYRYNPFTGKFDRVDTTAIPTGVVTEFDVQAHSGSGTDPVVPTAGGVVTVSGGTAVAGTTPVQTNSLSANSYTVQVQTSQALASTDATKIGLCNFSSSHFAVDANGFVTLVGGGSAIDSIGTQTGTNPIVPSGTGLVTINGAVVAAGTNPIRSDGTGANTMAIEVQISQALAAADATKIGLSNFDSNHFAVDADGFVSLTGISTPVWVDQASGTTAASNTNYFCTAALTLTLPASPSQGETIMVNCDTAGAVVVAANTGQTIRLGASISASAGNLTSTSIGDALTLVYRTTGTTWHVQNAVGTWTIN